MKGRKGREEAVYLRYELVKRVEKTAEKLGVSKSDLYRHAIMEYLERIGMLKHEE